MLYKHTFCNRSPRKYMILLRYAQNRYDEAKFAIEAALPVGPRGKRVITQVEFKQEIVGANRSIFVHTWGRIQTAMTLSKSRRWHCLGRRG